MKPKTYAKYRWIIESGVFQEKDLISFRKALRHAGNSDAQASDLLRRFNTGAPFRISADQTEKGLAYLRKALYKKNGDLRVSVSRPFSNSACESIKGIIYNFSHWTLDALVEPNSNSFSNLPNYAPVYTLHAKTGDKFSYYCMPLCKPEEY